MPDCNEKLTSILDRISSGEAEAQQELFALVYDELRGMAQRMMDRESADHTLQPTALVHEAAMRLLDSKTLERGGNRSYFFGAMSLAMRRVLVDHARSLSTQRRGAGRRNVSLDSLVRQVEETNRVDLVALDDLLFQLERLSPRQSEIVMRRFFGGFEMQEIADQLNVSVSTIQKDWRTARTWLRHRLAEGNA